MKSINVLTFIASLLMLVLLVNDFINGKTKIEPPVGGKGFALIELFTSEGCSSCPAADDLLATIQKEAQDKPVYVLAYHVDYWDRLGWKDRFSNSEYSRRQVAYSHWLNEPQIYTPQVIINGKAGYVGSDETALRKALNRSLTTESLASVTLKAQQNGESLTVNYQVTGGTTSDRLLLAVVQKMASSKVRSGENSGRTLSHAQIVHGLYQMSLTQQKKGQSTIKLPAYFNQQDWEVIGFVQNATTGEIFGATRATIADLPDAGL
ncbi:DUF1223 domain-containing protein [Spirosoma aureum]|uniref:DUF1223 domain-containing protein n=1 Tax=Spirosoma aureum TaxID=2692134 RepID=A0A6G9ARM4_9BACT|nr:DUF1223 domain-containing protein [Spirosoma aureum]QIP14935.1 DUF1223 domain-containing protein [Spirosoma aureum]